VVWEVEFTDEFETWWNDLSDEEQDKIDSAVGLLQRVGPSLEFPHSSGVASRHGHLRELRVQAHGDPFRILYAFDPRRVAILLVGGDKTGDDRWYEVNVPNAERLYDLHFSALDKESGKKKGLT
jgi:hypothetical protein